MEDQGKEQYFKLLTYYYSRFYPFFSELSTKILSLTQNSATVSSSTAPSEEEGVTDNKKTAVSIENFPQTKNLNEPKVPTPSTDSANSTTATPNKTSNKTSKTPNKRNNKSQQNKANSKEKNVHPTKGLICSVCHRRFPYPSTLKLHLQSHRCLHLPRFACPRCPVTFSRASGLQVHQRLHTGERPFACAACPRAFAAKSNLTAHQTRVHSLERPFPCRHCSKTFRYLKGLRVHEAMVHRGGRPFGCSRCEEKFDRVSKLKVHQRVKHGETCSAKEKMESDSNSSSSSKK
ncbi:hypothetical protein TYRP_003825 [Tyrophagus putrescentiae]|nr:hypothetical protein TYRP_003825 [Tyrophagus putrescentiae]